MTDAGRYGTVGILLPPQDMKTKHVSRSLRAATVSALTKCRHTDLKPSVVIRI